MEFVTRAVKIEAEEIVEAYMTISGREKHEWFVKTSECRQKSVVSKQDIKIGDYLNVTDPGDIYHVPKRFFEGRGRKYDRVVK